MSEPVTPPLLIEAVECAPGGDDKVIVRVTGKWQGSRKRGADARPVLVVQKDGRLHQFRAMPETRWPRIHRPGAWVVSFVLPTWLEPRLGGQMSLWIGEAEIPLPTGPPEDHLLDPPHDGLPAAPSEERVLAPPEPPPAPRQLRRTQLPPPQRQNGTRAPRAPQPAAVRRPAAPEPELEATVAALRAELQERAASDARDRARLADAQAELKARSSRQAELETTQAELRAELDKLQRLAAERDELITQVSALRAELAGAKVAREAAESEALGWRDEVERLGGEFAAARDELAERDGGLGEAEDLLAQARALRTRIQRQGVGVAASAADGS